MHSSVAVCSPNHLSKSSKAGLLPVPSCCIACAFTLLVKGLCISRKYSGRPSADAQLVSAMTLAGIGSRRVNTFSAFASNSPSFSCDLQYALSFSWRFAQRIRRLFEIQSQSAGFLLFSCMSRCMACICFGAAPISAPTAFSKSDRGGEVLVSWSHRFAGLFNLSSTHCSGVTGLSDQTSFISMGINENSTGPCPEDFEAPRRFLGLCLQLRRHLGQSLADKIHDTHHVIRAGCVASDEESVVACWLLAKTIISPPYFFTIGSGKPAARLCQGFPSIDLHRQMAHRRLADSSVVQHAQ